MMEMRGGELAWVADMVADMVAGRHLDRRAFPRSTPREDASKRAPNDV